MNYKNGYLNWKWIFFYMIFTRVRSTICLKSTLIIPIISFFNAWIYVRYLILMFNGKGLGFEGTHAALQGTRILCNETARLPQSKLKPNTIRRRSDRRRDKEETTASRYDELQSHGKERNYPWLNGLSLNGLQYSTRWDLKKTVSLLNFFSLKKMTLAL